MSRQYPSVLKLSVVIFLFISAVFHLFLSAETIELPRIPESIEDFISLRDEIAVTSSGGAAVFVLALYIYTFDEELGLQALTVTLVNDDLHLYKGSGVYKGYSPTNPMRYLLDRVLPKPYIVRSYFTGAVPENNYDMGDLPFVIETSTNKYSPSKAIAFDFFPLAVNCAKAPAPGV